MCDLPRRNVTAFLVATAAATLFLLLLFVILLKSDLQTQLRNASAVCTFYEMMRTKVGKLIMRVRAAPALTLNKGATYFILRRRANNSGTLRGHGCVVRAVFGKSNIAYLSAFFHAPNLYCARTLPVASNLHCIHNARSLLAAASKNNNASNSSLRALLPENNLKITLQQLFRSLINGPMYVRVCSFP